jgi:glycine cleavage system pyridoxal-binding protein P
MFVDNVVTSGHQAKTVALNYSLQAQEQKIKRNKAKSKRQ